MLFFDDLDDQFNFDWNLYGPGNQFIQGAFFDSEITLPGEGNYILVISGSFDAGTINYNFQVNKLN